MRRSARLLALVALAAIGARDTPARVDLVSPTGSVVAPEQVRIRFSQPMVTLGDPRAPAPATVQCAPGEGRWVDTREWAFDFAQPLAGGLRCAFTLRPSLKTLAGASVTGAQRFAFDTGAPTLLHSAPASDSERADEAQVFALALNAQPTAASVATHARCIIEGLGEAVPFDELPQADAQTLLRGATKSYDLRYFLEQSGWRKPAYDDGEPPRRKLALLFGKCRRTLPAGGRISLVWGAGIESAAGLATAQPTRIDVKVREPFTARLSCSRVNAAARCSPVEELRLAFSAPVSADIAARVRLVGPDASRAPKPVERNAPLVSEVVFAAPLPEEAAFRIELPRGFRDEGGRALMNAARFPLGVRTDAAPPLVKFASTFGIIEAAEGGVLPVTMRNVEPTLGGRVEVVPARALKDDDTDGAVAGWLRRLADAEKRTYDEFPVAGTEDTRRVETTRRTPLIAPTTRARSILVPKPAGARAFEVVGIPLGEPGFYVVELASPRLGAALLGAGQTRYVATGALVTDMSVHFAWGRGASLAWVTRLSDARPVARAAVTVTDSCTGRVLARAVADERGRALIPAGLPEPDRYGDCENAGHPLMISARSDDDFSFTLTGWNDGIGPSDFRLPVGYGFDARAGHTIFDRTLIRGGETIHMKHVVRQRTEAGFARSGGPEKATLTIRHLGSEGGYKQPVVIGSDGIGLSDWSAPKEAALGEYSVSIGERETGRFSLEEFRLPTMRAEVRGPQRPPVAAPTVPLDLSLAYLNGGAAGGAAVTLRTRVTPRDVMVRDYPDFSWTADRVIVGVVAEGTELDRARPVRADVLPLSLDAEGRARAAAPLPRVERASVLSAEMDYDDANGERRTASARVNIEPASVRVGVRGNGWIMKADDVRLKLVVLDLRDRPVRNAAVDVELFSRETYSYRKRLIGGFYAYDDSTETRRLSVRCSGRTDALGYAECRMDAGVSGEVIALAATRDSDGNVARASTSLYLAGDGEWWFGGDNGDRMDLLPERAEYRTGETARFQVRMPFRSATALVTVSRDGILDSFVTELSGKEPVVEVTVKSGWSPNVYVSVLAVRGRVAGWRLRLAELARKWGLPGWLAPAEAQAPTALVDLAKPSYRLGMTNLRVGWDERRLAVRVQPAAQRYRVRQTAEVALAVAAPAGRPLPPDAEVAVAAVDEALLSLKANDSWDLLTAMMAERPGFVSFSTAQTQVVGKRHYGKKAVRAGGGGGIGGAPPRADFRPLLLWRARVPLDSNGRASIRVPLNESLSSFRIAAVATAGADLFGTGEATIATTQDLILISGLPPVVREGDRYTAEAMLRNTTDKAVRATVAAQVGDAALANLTAEVAADGQHRFQWTVTAPQTPGQLRWRVAAQAPGASDVIEIDQTVAPAVPIETLAASLVQLDGRQQVPIGLPDGAIPGRGGITVAFSRTLGGNLQSAKDWMRAYPYNCLEQDLSRAVVLGDRVAWDRLAAALPRYLDSEGLLRFFPADWLAGDDSLTAYVLTLSAESGWPLPDEARSKMVGALTKLVGGGGRSHEEVMAVEKGRGTPGRASFAGDFALRRVNAIAALARAGAATSAMLDTVAADPNAWPTSTVADWLDAHSRLAPNTRAAVQASAVLRARLDSQGAALALTRPDAMWWLLGSPDSTAARLLLAITARPEWLSDAPRVARGLVVRSRRGAWDTTVSNALATLALARFSARFEATPVSGEAEAALGAARRAVSWTSDTPAPVALPWGPGPLTLIQQGPGAPWALVSARAAVPLTKPFASGFAVRRTVTPVSRARGGQWSRGDVLRVRVEVEARADVNWTVIDDPVPAGATVLGGGLGGRSAILDETGATTPSGPQPAYVERRRDSARAYYNWIPRGRLSYEYTFRLGAFGRFALPPTRVEALYVPGMIAMVPNAPIEVQP